MLFSASGRASQQLRQNLPAAMYHRAAAMYELLSSSHATGREPWSSMFLDGHGDHWRKVTEYVKRHHGVWVSTLAELPEHVALVRAGRPITTVAVELGVSAAAIHPWVHQTRSLQNCPKPFTIQPPKTTRIRASSIAKHGSIRRLR